LKACIYRLSALLNVAGLFLVLLMVTLIVVDILSRLLFNIALPGQYELVECMMGLVIVFALGYTQVKNGHVRITSLIEMLPKGAQSWVQRLVNLLGLIMFAVITYESFIKSGMEVTAGTTSAVLYIPIYPFRYACTFGFALLTLVYLCQMLLPDESDQKKDEQPDLVI
jgi:TRAP-type C4-dicarboxylate transport system permease small subunit